MADLWRNGSELLRLTERVDTPDCAEVEYEEVCYSHRSNGYVLRKLTVKYRPNPGAFSDEQRNGKRFTDGWKRHRKVKRGHSPADYAATKRAKFINHPNVKVG